MPPGGLLPNHAGALFLIGRHPESPGPEIAAAVGITERAIRRPVDASRGGRLPRTGVSRAPQPLTGG